MQIGGEPWPDRTQQAAPNRVTRTIRWSSTAAGSGPSSGRCYDTIDPFLGSAWVTPDDGDAGDVDLAAAVLEARAGAGCRDPFTLG
jgi:hypothetical protein